MGKDDLDEILTICIDKLYQNDCYLIMHDVHEQTISSAFSCYLKEHFQEWNVDTEYSRDDELPKKLTGKNKRPDIIIHKRGSNNSRGTEMNNLLVIEIKKNPTGEEKRKDLEKIDAFVNESPFLYCFGVFINLQKNKEDVSFDWRERGTLNA